MLLAADFFCGHFKITTVCGFQAAAMRKLAPGCALRFQQKIISVTMT